MQFRGPQIERRERQTLLTGCDPRKQSCTTMFSNVLILEETCLEKGELYGNPDADHINSVKVKLLATA